MTNTTDPAAEAAPRESMIACDIAKEIRDHLRPIETRAPQARVVGDVRAWQLSSLCLVTIELLNRAAAVEPEVVWTNGKAAVGGVTLIHSRVDAGYYDFERIALHAEGFYAHVNHLDETTAKRIALAVARELNSLETHESGEPT